MPVNVRISLSYALAALLPAALVTIAARGTISESAGELFERVAALHADCLSKAAKSSECATAAAPLVQGLGKASPSIFGFYREAAFNVVVQGGYVVALRKTCSTADISVDEFHWRVWPVDEADLETRWRAHGFVGGVASFARNGVIANGACLLILKMPFKNIKGIEIGQFDRKSATWAWRVTEEDLTKGPATFLQK